LYSGAPGVVVLSINGNEVGKGAIPVTVPLAYGLSGDGLSCGRDTLTPVSTGYTDEFPFAGVIRRVTVGVRRDQHSAAAPRIAIEKRRPSPALRVGVY